MYKLFYAKLYQQPGNEIWPLAATHPTHMAALSAKFQPVITDLASQQQLRIAVKGQTTSAPPCLVSCSRH